ncbi:MAG TPA: cytochrome c biogenesis protein DipZ [Patescibacteria group bacterium]|nr:cytochrome c biogenesis protein DipZ [Patescibacteria group bacterium]
MDEKETIYDIINVLMVVLLLFAFLSGLVTIAAPCIWPILPIVLSATVTGGHRKPLGITLGVLLSFGLLTLFLSSILAVIPFDPNILRYIAVVVLVFFGLTLIIPVFSRIFEGWVSRFSAKFQTTSQSTGFWSGFFAGLALGIVWAPCAGPILATIAALAATQKISAELIWVTISYCLGIGIPLFVFATLGRYIFTKTRFFSKYTGLIQQIFGVIMLLTAILILSNYDKVIEANLLNYFPSYSQFLNTLEGNQVVTDQLNALKQQKSVQLSADTTGLFNANYPAPDFVGIDKWLNLPEGLPTPSIKGLKGKVILVDFWTYTCINCIRTLPHVVNWYDKYKDNGFVVIGIHTPEFAFEHDTNNVLNAIKQFNIHYPVGQDNEYATWNNYNNQYWPAEYLIDSNGNVRRTEFGEGQYDKMEMAIQQLLKDAGKKVVSSITQMPDTMPTGNISPETYLGSNRMQYYFPTGSLPNGTQTFTLDNNPPTNSYSLGGSWTINSEEAVAGSGAVLTYHFQASKVYIILRPFAEQNLGTIKILLDGKTIDASVAGADVHNGIVTIDADRLYNIVNLSKTEDHVLQLEFLTPGLKAYTFTFG